MQQFYLLRRFCVVTSGIDSSETVTLLRINCCRRAGLRIGNIYGPGNGIIWFEVIHCGGNESVPEDCDHSGFGILHRRCGHEDDVAITCSTNLTNSIGKLVSSISNEAMVNRRFRRGIPGTNLLCMEPLSSTTPSGTDVSLGSDFQNFLRWS